METIFIYFFDWIYIKIESNWNALQFAGSKKIRWFFYARKFQGYEFRFKTWLTSIHNGRNPEEKFKQCLTKEVWCYTARIILLKLFTVFLQYVTWTCLFYKTFTFSNCMDPCFHSYKGPKIYNCVLAALNNWTKSWNHLRLSLKLV